MVCVNGLQDATQSASSHYSCCKYRRPRNAPFGDVVLCVAGGLKHTRPTQAKRPEQEAKDETKRTGLNSRDLLLLSADSVDVRECGFV